MKNILEQSPIIPVITIDELDYAYELAGRFASNGFNTLEITLRTPKAIDIINSLSQEFKHLTIGAGTIISVDCFEKILETKAQFAVSPGFVPAIATMAKLYSRPYLPGIASVSEAMQARTLGFNCLKLFPANAIGGVELLKAMAAVLPELRFCPTGGINLDNAKDYLALDNVISVGMSAIAPPHMIKNKDWAGIEARIKQARSLL